MDKEAKSKWGKNPEVAKADAALTPVATEPEPEPEVEPEAPSEEE